MANPNHAAHESSNTLPLVLSWTFVGLPLAWGISLTLINVAKLFK